MRFTKMPLGPETLKALISRWVKRIFLKGVEAEMISRPLSAFPE